MSHSVGHKSNQELVIHNFGATIASVNISCQTNGCHIPCDSQLGKSADYSSLRKMLEPSSIMNFYLLLLFIIAEKTSNTVLNNSGHPDFSGNALRFSS